MIDQKTKKDKKKDQKEEDLVTNLLKQSIEDK